MVTIYPKRGILYISWTEKDRSGRLVRVTNSLRLKDTRINRGIAEKVKRDKLRQLQLNPVVIHHYYKLEEAIRDFLRLKEATTQDNYTVYRIALDYLVEYFTGKIFVRDIQDLTGFYDFLRTRDNANIKKEELKRKISVNTAASYMRNVKVFFNWLYDREYIATVPQLPKIKKVKTRRRPCPISVVITALDYLQQKEDKEQYVAILILLLTGLRVGELCRLKWEDIDFLNDIIYVDNTKGGRENEIFPLYPTAKALLHPLKKESGKVVSYKNKDSFRFWGRTLRLLKFEHYSVHSIRKTFGTELGRVSAPIKVSKDLMRHQNYKTTIDSYTFAELREMSRYAEEAIGSHLHNLLLKAG